MSEFDANTTRSGRAGQPELNRLAHQLVDAFYAAMDRREDARTVRAMHDADLTQTKAILTKYLIGWLTLPHVPGAVPGAVPLHHRHRHFRIDADASAAWLNCMREALAETIPDAAWRAELEARLTQLAQALENTEPLTRASSAGPPPTGRLDHPPGG